MKTSSFGQSLRLLLAFAWPFFCTVQTGHATTVYSKQSGPWSAATTWQGNQVPSYNDYIIIQTGHTVINANPFTQNGFLDVRGTLVLSGNAVRTFSTTSSLDIDGLLSIEGGTNHFDCITYGSGTLRQTSGSSYFDKYHVHVTDLQGGSAYYYGNQSIDFPTLKLKNALLDGADDLEVSENMAWGNNGSLDQGSKLVIKAGATLDLLEGGIFKNSGTIYNYGTVNCTFGTLKNHNSNGQIGNNGQWRFHTVAGKTFGFDKQNFVNNVEVIKEEAGTVNFPIGSEFYQSSAGATFHLQQGTFNTTETGSLGLLGLWQIDAGGILNYSPGNFGHFVNYLGPKIINNGQIKGTRWRIDGGDDMILEGSGKIERLEVNKSGNGNVILAGSPEITAELTLTSGHLVLGPYDLRLGSAGISYTSSFESYIETNGTGSCVRLCPAGASTFFPVGNADFAPFLVQMNAGSTQDFVKVRVAAAIYGEYAGATPACTEPVSVGVVAHSWTVAEQTPGGSMAGLSAYWLPGAERTGFDRYNCTLGRYLSGDWQPGAFAAAEDYSPFFVANRLNVSSFGQFGVFDAGHTGDVNFAQPAPVASTPVCEWSDLQLQANTSPNAEVQWTGPNGFQSNQHDPVVAGIQLSQGGVYAVLASQYGCPEKQATVSVQVNAEPTPTIVGPGQVQPGGSVTLTAYGGTAYVWNTGAATQAVTVTPVQATDYEVTVTNPAGCTATAVHTVQVSGASAAHEAAATIGAIQIAPNPAFDATALTFESLATGQAQLIVTDVQGAQWYRQTVAIPEGRRQLTIPLTGLPAGVYQVSLMRENEVKTVRLIKMAGE